MRALSILFAGLVLGACAPSSSEQDELRQRALELRAAGRLPGPDASVPVPAAVRDFFERFERARARFAENPPAPDDRVALAAFQAQAAMLTDLRVCRTALRRRESLARPAREFPPSPTAELIDTPGLHVIREWTELLCARARLEADGGPQGNGAAASASLVTALELLCLWNDHSLIGEVVCSSQERVVLETLRALAPLDSVDARALRIAVDPYLQPRPLAELVQTATIETSFWMRAVDGLLASGERVSPAQMEQLGFTGASFVLATHALLDRHEALLDLEDDPCLVDLGDGEAVDGPRLGYALREWHERNVRLALARVGLAVVAWREEAGDWPEGLEEVAGLFVGGVPAHPCARLRFAYARGEDGFRVSSVDGDAREDARGHGHEAEAAIAAGGVRAAWSWVPGIGGQ